MSSRVSALVLVALMLSSLMIYSPRTDNPVLDSNNLFEGFTTDTSIWNETPFRDVAVPSGFNLSLIHI